MPLSPPADAPTPSSFCQSFKAKKDKSPVTIADYGAQAVISLVLAAAFPSEPVSIVGEEDATELRTAEQAAIRAKVVDAVNAAVAAYGDPPEGMPRLPAALSEDQVLEAIDRGGSAGGPSGRHWVLDPVDGTLGFVRGDQYAISLGLVEDGRLVAGVLGCPNYPQRGAWLQHPHRFFRLAEKLLKRDPTAWTKGIVFLARRGAGCFAEPLVAAGGAGGAPPAARRVAVRVSRCVDPANAVFCEPVEKGNSSQSYTASLAKGLGVGRGAMRMYSSAKYGAIARGDAEVFMKFPQASYKEKSWDHAAGVLLVAEAGGLVTDAGGAPIDFSSGRLLEVDRGLLAANRTLHRMLVVAVESSWASSML